MLFLSRNSIFNYLLISIVLIYIAENIKVKIFFTKCIMVQEFQDQLLQFGTVFHKF